MSPEEVDRDETTDTLREGPCQGDGKGCMIQGCVFLLFLRVCAMYNPFFPVMTHSHHIWWCRSNFKSFLKPSVDYAELGLNHVFWGFWVSPLTSLLLNFLIFQRKSWPRWSLRSQSLSFLKSFVLMKLKHDANGTTFFPNSPLPLVMPLALVLVAAQSIPYPKEESVPKRNMGSD